VPNVVLDANVFVSLLTGRHEKQYEAARSLLQQAEEGDLVAIVPQFVVFEVAYVLQSLYAVTGGRLASIIQEVVVFPGVRIDDGCPWARAFELWPAPLVSLADAAIVALTLTNRYDAIATFDRKLARRATDLGVRAYW
jgi:predicted nucleic acid-binding protein